MCLSPCTGTAAFFFRDSASSGPPQACQASTARCGGHGRGSLQATTAWSSVRNHAGWEQARKGGATVQLDPAGGSETTRLRRGGSGSAVAAVGSGDVIGQLGRGDLTGGRGHQSRCVPCRVGTTSLSGLAAFTVGGSRSLSDAENAPEPLNGSLVTPNTSAYWASRSCWPRFPAPGTGCPAPTEG